MGIFFIQNMIFFVLCNLILAEESEKKYCENLCSEKYLSCQNTCSEVSCQQNCNRELVQCENDCPFHPGCQGGCPCQNYKCRDRILVVNSASGQKASIFEWGEKENYIENIDFTYEAETSAYYSCSFVLNGKFYIAGGLKTSRQISLVQDCHLRKSEITLPISFDNGQCTTLQENSFLCFPYDHRSDCLIFDGAQFIQMPSSQNKHYLGTINSWNQKILAISDIDHVTSEMFNTEVSTWESFEPLPGAKYAYYLSSVNFREKVYVFGGNGQIKDSNFIGSQVKTFIFDGSWKIGQDLLKARDSHRSIISGNFIYHIGGMEDQITTIIRCHLNDGNLMKKLEILHRLYQKLNFKSTSGILSLFYLILIFVTTDFQENM